MALSPQADLATELRWPRLTATFGSQAALTSALAGAYVAGFQGGDKRLNADGVLTVVKHWVGYGAAVDGYKGRNRSTPAEVLFLVSLLLVFPAVAATSGNDKPRNIIFILLDDLRFDGMGFLQPELQTPNIDTLARSGVYFPTRMADSLK